jgi:membrane fusion protein, copper/silver efflux system
MNRKAVIIGISVAAAIILLLIIGYLLKEKHAPLKAPLPVVQEKAVQLNKPQLIISDEDQKLMGIRKTEISSVSFKKTIKIKGKIDYDSERTSEVETNISGIVETISAEEGKYVKKGDLLIEVNSPGILSAQQDLIAATRPGSSSGNESAASSAETARKKLRQMGISDDLISQIEKTGTYSKTVKIVSPITGYVVKKLVSKGDPISDGNKLIVIADLGSVMFVGDASELDAPLIKKGQEAEILINDYPDKIFKTKTEDVIPSGVIGKPPKASMRIANPENGLKPGLEGTAEIKIDLGARLAVPMEAIIDKDGSKIVYVETNEGKFEARIIRTGINFDSLTEVVDGLKEGEMVVSSGVTKVDSEVDHQRAH